MGGAPTSAGPYTFAWCREMTSRLVQRSHWPLTGNAPYPFASGTPEASSNDSE